MMDLIGYAPRLPKPGETLIGRSFSRRLGGKGYNQAVAARRAGAQVSFIGALGDDDFARYFREGLASESIDGTHVVSKAGFGTGVGLPVVEDTGQNSIVIVPRANMEVSPEDVERSKESI